MDLKRLKVCEVLILAALAHGCGEPGGSEGPFPKDARASKLQVSTSPIIDTVENNKKVEFSLAAYLANEGKDSDLARHVAPGETHISLGSQDKFAIQTNIEVHSLVNKGFKDEKTGILGRYFADAFVFNKRIGGNGVGSLLEIGIDAMEQSLGLYGRIRYLGQERLAGKLNSKIDKMLTRSLTQDGLVYGSPLLGLKVTGNIGGEIGISADVDQRVDKAITMGFTPRSAINAGLGGKLELLSFARAEIAGTVGLVNTDMTTQGSVGTLRDIGITLGDVGMASGAFRALDGKVAIGASAGSENSLLPTSVNTSLWSKFDATMQQSLKMILPKMPDWKWVHVVWDPTPVNVTNLPIYSKPFLSYLNQKKSKTECLERYEEFSKTIDQIAKNTEDLTRAINDQYEASTEKDPTLLQRMRILATNKTNYRLIQSKAKEDCENIYD